MKMIKRIAAFAGALCLSASMFAGCGSKSDDDEKEMEKAAAQVENELGRNSGASENKVSEIAPFDNLKVEFEGASPAITVKLSGGHSKVKYQADVEKGLKKGDVVTVTATVSPAYKKDFNLTETEKQYPVEGVDVYSEKLEDIPKETIDKMDKTFRDGYADYFKAGKINSMELAGNYMLTKKDAADLYNKKYEQLYNRIYFVYKINAEVTATGESHDYYWCAFYNNVKQLADGTMDVDYVNLNKGLSDIGIYNGIDGCADAETLYNKNGTPYEEEYNIVSTVK